MTFEEIERLVKLMGGMGISKIRLTGGEPFVRTDLMQLIRRIIRIDGIKDVHLTTNGILAGQHVAELKSLGIASVNLSLDTLDRERFKVITRRDEFEKTRETLHALLDHHIPVKINAVVMEGKNIDDIYSLVELTRNHPISVRFIEEMPFNGEGSHYSSLVWTYRKILDHIRQEYPGIVKVQDPENSTSYNYHIPGFKGEVGIIAAFSRTFCGTCNRIRITSQGDLKTCLYDAGVLNIRNLMRSGHDDKQIEEHLLRAFASRPKDGHEAEATRRQQSVLESMATIGG